MFSPYSTKKAYLHNDSAQPFEILYTHSVAIAEQVKKNWTKTHCAVHVHPMYYPKKAYLHNDSAQPSEILYMRSVAIEEQILKKTKKIEQKLTVQYMSTPCTT